MILQFLGPFKTIFYCFFGYCVLKKKTVLVHSLPAMPTCPFCYVSPFLQLPVSFSFKWLLFNIIFTARDVLLQSDRKLWQEVRAASVCAQGQDSEAAAAQTSQAPSVDR